jgi:hypothetical protein
VDPSFRPRKQMLWKMSKDKAEGARNKVKILLSAGVIREVKYLERLANTVMVKKANGKWRMCIDFTDLNKACPKDEIPLPRIDSLVDAAASLELMSLLDLQETFANFKQAGLKLNPEKCVFGVKKGKFLGCLVSTTGIEANPCKIEAIIRMEPPSTKKGAQRLAGRLASLNRFIS